METISKQEMAVRLEDLIKDRFQSRFDMPLEFDDRTNEIIRNTAETAYMAWAIEFMIENPLLPTK